MSAKGISITLLVVVVLVLLGIFIMREGTPGTEAEPAATETGDQVLPLETDSEDEATQGTADEEDTASAANKDDTAESGVVISYTASGFSPKTVTVPAGSTVTFTNESASGMWVASAVHPTHSVYPEKTSGDCAGSAFDACGSVGAGESWSFTFNETGEWKYHNHARTAHTGTVVVE